MHTCLQPFIRSYHVNLPKKASIHRYGNASSLEQATTNTFTQQDYDNMNQLHKAILTAHDFHDKPWLTKPSNQPTYHFILDMNALIRAYNKPSNKNTCFQANHHSRSYNSHHNNLPIHANISLWKATQNQSNIEVHDSPTINISKIGLATLNEKWKLHTWPPRQC